MSAPTPSPPRRLRHGAALAVVDQAVSSATNFVAVFAAATALSAHDFGEFTLGYGAVVLAMGLIQATVSQEFVLFTGNHRLLATRVTSAATFTVVLAATGSACALVIAAIGPGLRAPALIAALTLPALALQDAARFIAATVGRMEVALLLDVVWLGLMIIGAGAAHRVHPGPSAFLLAWCGSGACAGLLAAYVLTRLGARSRGWREDLADYRRRTFVGYRFLVEFIVVRGSNQALTLSLGLLVGAEGAGAFRGVTTLFGPVNVVVQAVGSFFVPILARRSRRSRERILALLGATLGALGSAAAAVLYALPDATGRRLLGETWQVGHPLIVPLGIQAACVGTVICVLMAMRIADPTSSLSFQCITTVVFVSSFLLLVIVDGVDGAAWAMAAGTGFQALLGLAFYRRVRSRGSSGSEPALTSLTAPVVSRG